MAASCTAVLCQSCPSAVRMQHCKLTFTGKCSAALLRPARLQRFLPQSAAVATWTPPSDPSSMPSVPPEFTPPDQQPSYIPGVPPEFEPPEQSPPGPRPTDPPRPGRIARPEVPDPERDPMRSPDRRREINEPAPDTEPPPLPDRE